MNAERNDPYFALDLWVLIDKFLVLFYVQTMNKQAYSHSRPPNLPSVKGGTALWPINHPLIDIIREGLFLLDYQFRNT
jgi:hypothetical protein